MMMTSGGGGVSGATADVSCKSSVGPSLQLTSHSEESRELLKVCKHTALPAKRRGLEKVEKK